MKKYLQPLKTKWKQEQEKIRMQLNRLSPRQRLALVFALLSVFLFVDSLYVWSGFSGATAPPKSPVEHIRPVPLEAPGRADKTDYSPLPFFNYGTTDTTQHR